MIIIHTMERALPRLLTDAVQRTARAMPVVVVTGARQTGKSTLARELPPGADRLYLSLDDLDLLEQARDDPEDLIARGDRIALDEIQRAPELMLAVKRAVDRRRQKGRFLLTGSANLLVMRSVADSLAGRAGYLTLWPMTRREQLGLGRAGLWDELIAAPDDAWLDVLERQTAMPEEWRSAVARGGYPTPALELSSRADRNTWFSGYVKSYLERDIRDISSISALPDLRRLMRATALRVGQLVNQTELGRDVALPQATVHRYLNLLETSYQLVRLPAYAVNRTRRLIKTPKAYWADCGLGLHLAGVEKAEGAHLENLVLCDLLAWREGRADAADLFYWRTASGEEIDFIIEVEGKVIPVEVKATTRPRVSDAKALKSFREEYGGAARTALLLHAGDRLEWLGRGILAAPWWRVL